MNEQKKVAPKTEQKPQVKDNELSDRDLEMVSAGGGKAIVIRPYGYYRGYGRRRY